MRPQCDHIPEVKCKFAYGLDNATATLSSLASLKSRTVYPMCPGGGYKTKAVIWNNNTLAINMDDGLSTSRS